MEFDPNTLYACGPEGGDIAGQVWYDKTRQVIQWFQPGGRQRCYEIGGVLEDSEERFAFVDSVGRKFVLFPLTPEFFNEHIRHPGTPSYATMAELLKAYRSSL